MTSLLRLVFCCCLGKRVRDPGILDDRSRLIPASTGDVEALTSEAQGPGGARVVFDQVRFKERLGGIVRSKEGKMVNVTSPLPFNLHNRPLALATSRSASTSTFPGSQSPTHQQPHIHQRPPPPLHIHSGLRITPISSTPHSHSRSRSSSRSRSQTSLTHGDEEPMDVPPPKLGVRLVHGYGSDVIAAGRRGRTKVKKDLEDGVHDDLDLLATAVPPDLDTNTPRADAYTHTHTPRPHPRLSISPASDMLEFRIRDMGALSVSWGE
ncbi:hypothetical protein Hypma_008316 [Hypsizygus marmoreus]|uniref:Uncharacterized protein n=1 Tax=Hypsizygus marmoreus TaxID=39966 RepID=A0A369JYL0_HYPMA|nr:hypothetical protein Hypma_008316 [Hypsizygus marmoreus]